jgi:hypothetical protein
MVGDGYFRGGNRVIVVVVMLRRASWNPPQQHVRELAARPRTQPWEARELMARPRTLAPSKGTDGSPMEPKPRGHSSCRGHSTQNQPLQPAESME